VSAGQLEAIDPRTDARWRALSLSGHGSLFTSPPWIRAVCDTYDFVPHARIVIDTSGGDAASGFSWILVDDLRGRRSIALPFCDRAEPIVSDPSHWPLLRDEALRDKAPLSLRTLDHNVAAADPLLTRAGEAAWHRTPLDGDIESLHRRLNSAARRNIAAAERHGVRIRIERDLAAVRQFHALHVRLRRTKYRLLAQPIELFERIWKEFTDDGDVAVLLADVAGRTIAGAMYLQWGDTFYYKFGASLQESLAARPNEALAWAALRLASERGLAGLDWGLSDLDQPGLVAYKRKWASIEGRIVTLRYSITPQVGHPAADALLGNLSQLLTEDVVPDEIAARAGALLYRYFC
jgi:CelD/BcsL family acetyltransferase involved in cellulose biosynthesis